jgi:hypothetical protein
MDKLTSALTTAKDPHQCQLFKEMLTAAVADTLPSFNRSNGSSTASRSYIGYYLTDPPRMPPQALWVGLSERGDDWTAIRFVTWDLPVTPDAAEQEGFRVEADEYTLSGTKCVRRLPLDGDFFALSGAEQLQRIEEFLGRCREGIENIINASQRPAGD